MRRISRILVASVVAPSLVGALGAAPPTPAAKRSTVPVPASLVENAREVPPSQMRRIYEGVVYHFYCAVGPEGRVIALATSKDLRGAAKEA